MLSVPCDILSDIACPSQSSPVKEMQLKVSAVRINKHVP